MNKTLIIVRHAHRDKSEGREVDNGLTKKGRAQALRVAAFFERRFTDESPKLISSPKKRCSETLVPLSQLMKVPLLESDLLVEQQDKPRKESLESFRGRIQKFYREWTKSDSELTVVCSHGDWIPFFLEESVHLSTGLKKGGWAEIELQEETPHLTWLMQEIPQL